MPARKKQRARADGRGQYDRSLDEKTRKARQRAALIEAATQVFGTAGVRAATVELIVAQAGMSRRTFYDQFTDLADCLRCVHGALAEEAYSLIRALIADLDDPLDRVRTGIGAYFAAIVTHPVAARVLFREIRNAGPVFEKRWEKETGRFAALLFEALREAHAQGRLKHAPDETSVLALTIGIEAVGMHHLSRGTEAQLFTESIKLGELVIRAFS